MVWPLWNQCKRWFRFKTIKMSIRWSLVVYWQTGPNLRHLSTYNYRCKTLSVDRSRWRPFGKKSWTFRWWSIYRFYMPGRCCWNGLSKSTNKWKSPDEIDTCQKYPRSMCQSMSNSFCTRRDFDSETIRSTLWQKRPKVWKNGHVLCPKNKT